MSKLFVDGIKTSSSPLLLFRFSPHVRELRGTLFPRLPLLIESNQTLFSRAFLFILVFELECVVIWTPPAPPTTTTTTTRAKVTETATRALADINPMLRALPDPPLAPSYASLPVAGPRAQISVVTTLPALPQYTPTSERSFVQPVGTVLFPRSALLAVSSPRKLLSRIWNDFNHSRCTC